MSSKKVISGDFEASFYTTDFQNLNHPVRDLNNLHICGVKIIRNAEFIEDFHKVNGLILNSDFLGKTQVFPSKKNVENPFSCILYNFILNDIQLDDIIYESGGARGRIKGKIQTKEFKDNNVDEIKSKQSTPNTKSLDEKKGCRNRISPNLSNQRMGCRNRIVPNILRNDNVGASNFSNSTSTNSNVAGSQGMKSSGCLNTPLNSGTGCMNAPIGNGCSGGGVGSGCAGLGGCLSLGSGCFSSITRLLGLLLVLSFLFYMFRSCDFSSFYDNESDSTESNNDSNTSDKEHEFEKFEDNDEFQVIHDTIYIEKDNLEDSLDVKDNLDIDSSFVDSNPSDSLDFNEDDEKIDDSESQERIRDSIPPQNEVKTITILLPNVQFYTGESRLLKSSESGLNELALVLISDPDYFAEIFGHTDNVGDAEENLLLSQERAESVLDYLVLKGVERNRLKAIGKGESEPKADNDTVEGRLMNRRVEVQIHEVSNSEK